MSVEFENGYIAYLDGANLCACPHLMCDELQLFMQWVEGWRSAKFDCENL